MGGNKFKKLFVPTITCRSVISLLAAGRRVGIIKNQTAHCGFLSNEEMSAPLREVTSAAKAENCG